MIIGLHDALTSRNMLNATMAHQNVLVRNPNKRTAPNFVHFRLSVCMSMNVRAL